MALAAGGASAQSKAGPGYYGEVGYTTLKIHSNNNGYGITPKLLGLTLGKDLNENLSVEGVYAGTVSKDSDVVNGSRFTGSATAYGVYVKPKMDIAPGVEVFARMGALHSKFEDEGGSLAKTKLAYGAGLQMQIVQDVYGQLDYMNFFRDDGLTAKGFTLSLGMRF